MTPKAKVLLACAVLLGIAYVIFFTDLFRKQHIQIITLVRPDRASTIPRPRDSSPVYPVSFRFNKSYKFTSIKVVNATQYTTNKFILPLWHMVSDSNSVPRNAIVYGAPKIPGMRSAVARVKPQPLEAGVEYILLVEAGRLKAQTNFVAREFLPKETR
jgi:hypothetical protein